MPGNPSIKTGSVKAGFSYKDTKQTNEKPPYYLNYLLYLKKQGIRRNRLKTTSWILKTINENADLEKPDAVDQYIDNRPISNAYKAQLTQVYAQYCEFQKIPYNRPKFKKQASRPIRIPTEEKISMIIADSGRVLATKLTLSKETGLRPIEVHLLKVKDIDLERHLVYPTTAKNGASRTLRISERLASLIQTHITRFKLKLNDDLFKGHEEHYGDAFRRVRDRLADKLQDPSIKTIRLYDLRHYFATMLYHKTKDILLVKRQLGHKSINNTLIYIDLEATLYNTTDEWTCKTATNVKEATDLIENGFEYITEMEGYKLFRKRK
jgi:integrase